jgi:ribose-phosphate pyrophosphokinase
MAEVAGAAGTTQRPIVFALRGHGRFAAAGAETGSCTLTRFPNRELIARLATPVAGRRCVVIGSVAPPESQLARLTLLVHTLRRAGAASVTALMPYLAYARQDEAAAGESLGLAWVGGLLRAAGVQDVVTVDVHSAAAADVLGLPVRSLSPAAVIASRLPSEWRDAATFVAPDKGARERCAALAAAAGRPRAVAHLVKRRDARGVTHLGLHGVVGERALIVDDILDTGGTVVSCCRMLRAKGARRIALAVTHGLFTGSAARAVEGEGVEELWVTDSLRGPRVPRSAHVVALGPLLAPVVSTDRRAGESADPAAALDA